ncbi:MAG: ribokinase [Bacillota bacterium]|jgi:sugar/nucleoside kinase (ribokinase family)|nr:ribokinase [Bacillota bacterium]
MKYDCYLIGPVSLDYDEAVDGVVKKFIGGALIYSSYAELAGGRKIGAVTKMAKEDQYVLDPFYIRDLTVLPSKATTSIHNVYHTPDRERRTATVRGIMDSFRAADIPEVEAEIFQMAGLIYGDYDDELFPFLAKKGKVACDMQGFLRRAEDGALLFYDWEEKRKYLPYITYLKTDAAEAEIMTGLSDRREAAKKLFDWGAKEIMITHHTEVLVYDGETFYTCPLRARNLSGRTGRGDSTFGSYITERIDKNIPDALLYASALVSLKMETFGPFKGSRRDVEKYIQELYPEY